MITGESLLTGDPLHVDGREMDQEHQIENDRACGYGGYG